jgi:hypothetical protein
MAIQQTLTTSFKQEILQAQQDLATDTLKLALFTGLASLGPSTTVYTTLYEVASVGTGYTAGGLALTGVTINASTDGVVYVNFNNAVWNPAAFTARGGLIYNTSRSNKTVAVLDFGADKTCQSTFTVQMPANSATSALLRFN